MDLNFHGIFIIVKSNSKTKYERFIVISEKFIYKLSSLNISSFQWALAIEAIHSIKLNKSKKDYIKLSVKNSINKKIVNERKFPINTKDEYDFTFKYEKDAEDFLFQVRKHIFNNTKVDVKISY